MTKETVRGLPRHTVRRTIAAAFLACGLHACAATREEHAGPNYLQARAADLADALGVSVGFGPGFLARAQITRWVAAGVGSIGPAIPWSHYRFDPRFAGWNGRERGVWIELREEIGIGTFYACEASGELLAGDVESFGLEGRTAEDIAAELFLGLIGVAVTFRPLEMFDFVAGIFGADPKGDDGIG